MGRYPAVIELSAEEREELTRWSKSRTLAAGDVFKARLILALADGKSYSIVESELKTSRPTVARWKARFEKARMAGLDGQHKGSRPRRATPAVQAKLLKKDTTEAGRWQHALVVPEDGGRSRFEPRHGVPNAECISFLSDVVKQNPAPREIHIVLDNLSAHKTQAVKEFLDQNPRVRFHFTPTYSCWLNQVEICLPKSTAT